MTLNFTYNLDLRTWLTKCQDEPKCQISMSKVRSGHLVQTLSSDKRASRHTYTTGRSY